MDDVPPEAALVMLAATGNMSTGGSAIDRTWEAHEDNVEIAEEAARVVGLDVAGIDFIAPDITQPVRETGGAIVEVNAAPGFRMHTHPDRGRAAVRGASRDRPAVPGRDALADPDRRRDRLERQDDDGADDRAHDEEHGPQGRLTSTDGIYIDERLVKRVDASGPKSAQTVLQNPRVDFAVFEVARGGILREGLGYGANDVAVVLNVTGDHLGLREIDTIEQLAAVKRVIVEAVPETVGRC